jgi:hypothetical protein
MAVLALMVTVVQVAMLKGLKRRLETSEEYFRRVLWTG